MIKNISKITQQKLEELLNTKKLVIVEFYDEMIGSCYLVESILEQIIDYFNDRVFCYRLQLSLNPIITSKYHINISPTVVVFQNGEPVENLVGTFPKKQLMNLITTLLK